MNMQISDENLISTVSQSLDVPPERLSLASSRDSVEEWDSLGHIMLMLAVEREFGRKLRFEQIEQIQSIQDLKDALTGT
jgi:acyl carrier protein